MTTPDPELMEAVIGSEAFAIARGKPALLRRLLTLAATGQSLGAEAEDIEETLTEYALDPSESRYKRTELKLLAAGQGLPDSILNTGASAKELLEFVASVQAFGGNGFRELGDPDILSKIRQHGSKKASDEVCKSLAAAQFGIPDAVAGPLPLEKLLDGVANAQTMGLDAAVSRPDFWDDLGKLPPAEMLKKWQREVEKMEAAEQRRQQAALRKSAADLRRALRAAPTHKPKLQPAKKAVHRKKKKRRRHRRGPRVILGTPTIVRKKKLVDTRVVNFRNGATWVFKYYSDDSVDTVYTTPQGKTTTCHKRPGPLYRPMTDNPNLGLVAPIPDMVHCTVPTRAPGPLNGDGQERGPVGTE